MKCKVCGKEVAAAVSGVCMSCLQQEKPEPFVAPPPPVRGLFVLKRNGLYYTKCKPHWDKLSLAKIYVTLANTRMAQKALPGSEIIPLDECG